MKINRGTGIKANKALSKGETITNVCISFEHMNSDLIIYVINAILTKLSARKQFHLIFIRREDTEIQTFRILLS
jgi:hypothetical protein